MCVHSAANHPFLFPYSLSSNIWVVSVPLKSLPGIDQERQSRAYTELNHACLSLYCTVPCHDVPNSCFSLFSMTTPVVTKWMAQKRHSVGLLDLQLSCLYACVILKCENASKGFCMVRRRITHFDPTLHWKLSLLSLETLLSLCIGHFSCYLVTKLQ